ncbi:hypothetical protein Q604_UNBC06976G0001, partial [human gut metagenome]
MRVWAFRPHKGSLQSLLRGMGIDN